MNRPILFATVPICLVLATVVRLDAGDLNPPGGAVAPTMKTLSEVEPRIAVNATNTPGDADSLFKITQPGSYYLTGNITGVAGKHGVEITASGVTLDLNGFALLGVVGSLDGVSTTVVDLRNIAVVNGSIRSWGEDGVDLSPSNGINSRVADLLAADNTGGGILAGFGCTVSNCTTYQNFGNGISVASTCTLSNCSALINVADGISTGGGCTLSNCTALSNVGDGISTGDGSSISNCSALLNSNGISVGAGCTVADCTAGENELDGISTLFSGCTMSNCSATSNGGDGISTADGCTLSNCSASANTENGISTGGGSSISNCSAYANTGNGISSISGCTVADCTVQFNTLDGIRCSDQCVIRGNTCANNGIGAGNGAGIHATGFLNRIEGNTCTSADRGIDVDGSQNIIVRNTCSSNATNWDIAVFNAVAPIVQATTNGGAPIFGNTYAGSLGSTDPNANFTY